jgi:hypothetical protein
MRDLTETELALVSGGQNSVNFAVSATGTSGDNPPFSQTVSFSTPGGLSGSVSFTSGPGQASASTSITVSQSNP